MSQASIDESLRRMSIQESGTYEDERNANSYNGGSRSNSIQHQESYRDPPRNAYARSNVSNSPITYTFFLHNVKKSLVFSNVHVKKSRSIKWNFELKS